MRESNPFLTEGINQETINISRSRNKFIRCRSDKNKNAYNAQRNRCVKLAKNPSKAQYSNLKIKDFNDNKKFWKAVKVARVINKKLAFME